MIVFVVCRLASTKPLSIDFYRKYVSIECCQVCLTVATPVGVSSIFMAPHNNDLPSLTIIGKWNVETFVLITWPSQCIVIACVCTSVCHMCSCFCVCLWFGVYPVNPVYKGSCVCVNSCICVCLCGPVSSLFSCICLCVFCVYVPVSVFLYSCVCSCICVHVSVIEFVFLCLCSCVCSCSCVYIPVSVFVRVPFICQYSCIRVFVSVLFPCAGVCVAMSVCVPVSVHFSLKWLMIVYL